MKHATYSIRLHPACVDFPHSILVIDLQTRLINGRPLASPSLWSGVSVAVVPAVPAAATFFTVYGERPPSHKLCR